MYYDFRFRMRRGVLLDTVDGDWFSGHLRTVDGIVVETSPKMSKFIWQDIGHVMSWLFSKGCQRIYIYESEDHARQRERERRTARRALGEEAKNTRDENEFARKAWNAGPSILAPRW